MLEQLLRLNAALSGLGTDRAETDSGEASSPGGALKEKEKEKPADFTRWQERMGEIGEEESRPGEFMDGQREWTAEEVPFPDSPWRKKELERRTLPMPGRSRWEVPEENGTDGDSDPDFLERKQEREERAEFLEIEADAEKSYPLLEQLRRRERAAAFRGKPGAVEGKLFGDVSSPEASWSGHRGRVQTEFAGVPPMDGKISSRWEAAESRPLAGGGRDWAEQADRAFRRDSRRYDGGFYLY